MSLRSHFRTRKLSHKLNQLIRVMAPTLIALSFAGVAHAQGTMDFSGAQTLMGTFKTRFQDSSALFLVPEFSVGEPDG